MAKAKAQKTAPKHKSFNARRIAGQFSFRFSGFTMDANDTPFHLTGIGWFSLDGQGNLTGAQTSSTTQIARQGGVHKYSQYTLNGTYAVNANGTGTAIIDFTTKTPGSVPMQGYFDLMMAGSNRFWFMSTKEILSDGSAADEVVSGEAVKTS